MILKSGYSNVKMLYYLAMLSYVVTINEDLSKYGLWEQWRL